MAPRKIDWTQLFFGADLYSIDHQPSSDTIDRMKRLDMITDDHFDFGFNRRLYDILIEDQSIQRQRIHKGFPLFGLANNSDGDAAINYLLEAFIEDSLSSGHEAFDAPAANALKQMGIESKTLIELHQFIFNKMKMMLDPSTLRREFREAYPLSTAKLRTSSTTDQSIELVREIISNELRASFDSPPRDEKEVQDVVGALLRRIDPHPIPERPGPFFAGKGSKIDFTIKKNAIGIEVKLVKSSNASKYVDEINSDIIPYLEFVESIVFLVYDADNVIVDKRKVIDDLTRTHPGKVHVIIV